MRAHHEPVLVAEVLAWLRHGPGLYLDATLGDGGHSEALLDSEPGARLCGCDRDPFALAFARDRLERFGDRVTVAHSTFRELPGAHRAAGGEPFTGALFDLGLSSRQLDDPARGMSFQTEGPLDLRMDPSQGTSAAERLQVADEPSVAQVLRAHGDLREAATLARAMVAAARSGRLATTRDLVSVLDRALGGRRHPRRYAQAFQALRIWVNDEAADPSDVRFFRAAAVMAHAYLCAHAIQQSGRPLLTRYVVARDFATLMNALGGRAGMGADSSEGETRRTEPTHRYPAFVRWKRRPS